MGFFSTIKKWFSNLTKPKAQPIVPTKLTPSLGGLPAGAVPGAVQGVSPAVSTPETRALGDVTPAPKGGGSSSGTLSSGGMVASPSQPIISQYAQNQAAQRQAQAAAQAQMAQANAGIQAGMAQGAFSPGMTAQQFNQQYGLDAQANNELAKVNTQRAAQGKLPLSQEQYQDIGKNMAWNAFTGIGLAAALKMYSATNAALVVGTKGLIAGATGTAGTIAVNGATKTTTTSMFAKMGMSLPAAGLAVSVLGSYPFAGFILEEALQTLGFGTSSAIKLGNLELAEQAIALNEEFLNPDIFDQIKQKVPFLNVLHSLDNFYNAAKMKMAIDRMIIDDMRLQQQTGETEEEKLSRHRQEKLDMEKASVDYYVSEQKKLMEWERDAKRDEREDYARFWKEYRLEMMELERREREAIRTFWLEYRKEMQKMYDDSRPSTLKFGLL